MIEGLSDAENIKIMQEVLGVGEMEARFIMAIEKGEISGDIVNLALQPNDKCSAGIDAPSKNGSRRRPIGSLPEHATREPVGVKGERSK